MDMFRFLRWHFRGAITNPSFWGVMISLAGFLALLSNCPQPWPMIMSLFGMVMIFVDLVFNYFRASYQEWRWQQQELERELRRERP